MSSRAHVFVDHTHCGRHVTGLERVTLEFFSRDAPKPGTVEPRKNSSLPPVIATASSS